MGQVGKNANGEGSITYDKRRKRWRARISVETSEGIRRIHLGWFKTRDEAHGALVEALSKGGRRRISLDADKVRVAEYLEDWLQNTSRVNVTAGIQRQRETHVREHLDPYIGSEQAAALVESVRGTRYEALYAVAVWLGPRQAELAALTWADVNPEGRLLRVWRSVNTHRAGEVWSSTKSGEEREIILPENIAASLIRHRKMQAEEKLAAGASWRNPDLVFPNTKGGVNRRATLYENFQRHRERAGLPRMCFHDLRDTAGTLMIRGGVDVRTVAGILGHAGPAMTLRRYAHVLPDMRERAANLIDSYAV